MARQNCQSLENFLSSIAAPSNSDRHWLDGVSIEDVLVDEQLLAVATILLKILYMYNYYFVDTLV